MNSKSIGEISEAVFVATLLKLGKVVLRPFGDNQRYDLVIDSRGRFERVQCKTARKHGNVLEFDTCSSQVHRGHGKMGYKGQIEFFGVYSPDLEKCYLVPVEIVGNRTGTLRLRCRYGRSKNMHMAEEFELSPFSFRGRAPVS